MTTYKQAKYTLKNKEKYLGDSSLLVFKSSWEQRAFEFCDNNINVLFWGYEIFEIPYMKPLEKGFRPAKYYPDLYIEYINKSNEVIKELIEIKPNKQTKKSRSRNTIRKLQEDYVYQVNISKWQAAEKWCKARGITFSIATENGIFMKKSDK